MTTNTEPQETLNHLINLSTRVGMASVVTASRISVFRGSNTKSGRPKTHSSRGVLYFTKYPWQAETYGKYVHEFVITIRQPYHTDHRGLVDQFNVNGRDLKEFEDRGYDSVVYDEKTSAEPSQIIIFKPSQYTLVRPEPLSEQEINESWSKRTASDDVVEVPHSFHKVTVEPPKKKPFVGYVDYQGLEIDIEVKAGQYREKTNPEGVKWKRYMHNHYGEIRGTEATDGDLLDVYVGPNHDSSLVVVIHQHRPDDLSFDEDKVMIGFDSVEEAVDAYKKHYPKPGFYQEGEYEAFPIGRFWRWVKDERNFGKKVSARIR